MTFHKLELLANAHPLGWVIAAFVLGALLGSFLNVCIYRIPLGQSVVWARSHCMLCQARVRWHDNIPLISWCLLKGRCRDCGQRFTARYCFVELLTATLFALCAWKLSIPLAFVGMVFVSLLIVVAFIDLDHFVIPEGCVCVGAFIGVIIAGVYPNLLGQSHAFSGVAESLMGVFIGSGVIFWVLALAEHLLRKPAMGLGDVLLLGMIGAYTGWMGALFALFGGAALGVIIMLPIMALERIFGIRMGPRANPEAMLEEGFFTNNPAKETPELSFGMAIPFGPWLALGGFAYYVFFQNQFTLRFIFQG